MTPLSPFLECLAHRVLNKGLWMDLIIYLPVHHCWCKNHMPGLLDPFTSIPLVDPHSNP